MTLHFPHRVLVSSTALLALALLTGCGVIPTLPETYDVSLSASESRSAPIGSGPEILAGSIWAGYLSPEEGAYSYGGDQSECEFQRDDSLGNAEVKLRLAKVDTTGASKPKNEHR